MNINVFITIIITAFIGLPVYSQGLEEDPSIIYMKANVLYDNARYDEAVKMYNRVLNEDENFFEAYVMRAKTKYALGAYKGTKKDILQFIERNGVTKEVIKIMAKTELKLKNYPAAKNYIDTAIELDPYDAEQHRNLGTAFYGLKEKNEACEEWSHASTLGDNKSKELLQEHCSIYLSMQEETHAKHKHNTKQDNDRIESNTSNDRTETRVEDIVKSEDDRVIPDVPERIERPTELGKPTTSGKDKSKDEIKPVEDVDRDAFQEIEIDESLSVVIGNGLGKRKLDAKPDIFLIADKNGRVVVDICVDGKGNVTSAEINKDRSTINRGGIISLAIRKSKEFTFFPSFRDEQCGYMIYVIEAEKSDE